MSDYKHLSSRLLLFANLINIYIYIYVYIYIYRYYYRSIAGAVLQGEYRRDRIAVAVLQGAVLQGEYRRSIVEKYWRNIIAGAVSQRHCRRSITGTVLRDKLNIWVVLLAHYCNGEYCKESIAGILQGQYCMVLSIALGVFHEKYCRGSITWRVFQGYTLNKNTHTTPIEPIQLYIGNIIAKKIAHNCYL